MCDITLFIGHLYSNQRQKDIKLAKNITNFDMTVITTHDNGGRGPAELWEWCEIGGGVWEGSKLRDIVFAQPLGATSVS